MTDGEIQSGSARAPLADRPLSQPHPDRLSPTHPRYEEIVDAHARALARRAMSYPDPESGLAVLTADYLRVRGTCCDSGCRHCPYVV